MRAKGANWVPSNHEKEGFSPQIPGVVHNFFAEVATLTELTMSSAVATYEANEATAPVKIVTSVKTSLIAGKK